MVDMDVLYAFDDRLQTEKALLIAEFLENPHGKQPWPVVPSARLLKIWNDSARFGFVRDERGIDDIADRMISNAIRLQVNTELCGHTHRDPVDVVDDVFDDIEWTDELDELFGDYCEDEYGMWRISDYALDGLMDDAIELFATDDHGKKLEIIDRMLQRVHARGDVASYFVEGGSTTLSKR